jgi:hypothetical protein
MEDSEKPGEEPPLALARLQAARKKREWRNWQTHYFEVVAPQGVGVQVPPPAHIEIVFFEKLRDFGYPKILRKPLGQKCVNEAHHLNFIAWQRT